MSYENWLMKFLERKVKMVTADMGDYHLVMKPRETTVYANCDDTVYVNPEVVSTESRDVINALELFAEARSRGMVYGTILLRQFRQQYPDLRIYIWRK